MALSTLAVAVTLLVVCAAQTAPPPTFSGFPTPVCNDTAVIASTCVTRPPGYYCYPCSSSRYIQCYLGAGRIRTCPRSQVYDYVSRRCTPRSVATPCPLWPCPTDLALANGQAYGPPADSGNVTIPLTKAETFWVNCPVTGHCQAGMVFKVTVTCPSIPAAPKVYNISWTYQTTEDAVIPKRLPDIDAKCGDSLYFQWANGFHTVYKYNPESYTGEFVPGPPQLTYVCPIVPFMGSIPGESVLAVGATSGNASYVVPTNVTEFFVICQVPGHCHNGMFFKVSVRCRSKRPAPMVYTIDWEESLNAYKDMTVNCGDTLHFIWSSTPTEIHFHAVALVDPSVIPIATQPLTTK